MSAQAKDGPYYRWRRASEVPDLTPVQKGILLAITLHADKSGQCYPKVETLAEFASCSERAARDSIKHLVSCGLVDAMKRDGYVTTYTIRMDKWPARKPCTNEVQPLQGCSDCTPDDIAPLQPLPGGGAAIAGVGVQPLQGRGAAIAPEVAIQETNPKQPPEATRSDVPPVPVATPSPATQEPPCLAPPQAIPTSAPVSTAKEATNTQPGLFPVATADTAESPKKSKKPATKAQKTVNSEDVERIWKHFRQWHPLTKPAVPKGDGEQIATCLKEWTADEIMTVFTWAHESQHNDAVWLRSKDRDCVKTLTVQADFSRRLELAMREQRTKGPAPEKSEQVAPQEDPSAIWDSIIKRRSTGIRIMPDDIPPRTQNAIRAVGGWNQIGLLNDYTEKQARTAFIAAYRNQPLNGHQRTA